MSTKTACSKMYCYLPVPHGISVLPAEGVVTFATTGAQVRSQVRGGKRVKRVDCDQYAVHPLTGETVHLRSDAQLAKLTALGSPVAIRTVPRATSAGVGVVLPVSGEVTGEGGRLGIERVAVHPGEVFDDGSRTNSVLALGLDQRGAGVMRDRPADQPVALLMVYTEAGQWTPPKSRVVAAAPLNYSNDVAVARVVERSREIAAELAGPYRRAEQIYQTGKVVAGVVGMVSGAVVWPSAVVSVALKTAFPAAAGLVNGVDTAQTLWDTATYVDEVYRGELGDQLSRGTQVVHDQHQRLREREAQRVSPILPDTEQNLIDGVAVARLGSDAGQVRSVMVLAPEHESVEEALRALAVLAEANGLSKREVEAVVQNLSYRAKQPGGGLEACTTKVALDEISWVKANRRVEERQPGSPKTTRRVARERVDAAVRSASQVSSGVAQGLLVPEAYDLALGALSAATAARQQANRASRSKSPRQRPELGFVSPQSA